MKKIIKLVFSLLLTLFVAACNTEEIVSEKFMIKGHIENNEVINIDGESLQNMIEEDESFILLIMLNGCSSCESFKQNVVNPFVMESKSNIYAISSIELDSLEYDKKPSFNVAPTLIVYNNGESIIKVEYDYKNSMFSNKEDFKTFVNKYCIEPRLIELSEEIADEKLENNESFVMYIGWYRCGDCKMLNAEVLDNYLLENDITLFYLESDKYRSVKPSYEPILPENPTQQELKDKENWDNWINFSTKYGFNSYRDGKVPALIYYENGIVKDYIVYRNDVIEDEIVLNSFYTDLIGQNISTDELLKYHNDKVVEFLTKYCK